MKINTITIATNNPFKIKEFDTILKNKNIDVKKMDENFDLDSVETGLTFEENSLLKAKYLFEKINQPVLSDDSGIEIEALNNMPGVFSARFAFNGYDFTFKQLENMLNNVTNKKAKFVCCLCFYYGKNEYKIYKGVLNGKIKFPASGNNGFGYDPIFVPYGYDLCLAEMSIDAKNAISHRNAAINNFLNDIENICN